MAEEELEGVLIKPEDTTLRWFGPERPSTHSPRGEVPTPVGAACPVCGVVLVEGDQGWEMPHGWPGSDAKMRPYHHDCLVKLLGLGQEQ